MRAALQQTRDRKILQELVPLNALSEERFQELAGKILIEEVKAGSYLFRKGDRDNQSVYLLDGKVSLIDGLRKVVGEVEAGSDASRFPLAAQQPRSLAARVTQKAVIARIDSGLLDAFLTWDQSNTADVVDINLAENTDWMTRLLQSETFSQLPPAKLQGLLMRMRPVTVRSGQTIIRQGGPGDYFYTIHEGRCEVTRKDPGSGEVLKLAELSAGDCFGEDALVAQTVRNATVTMLTDGQLMRLAKQDFEELLRTEMVRHVGIEQAMQMVDAGAVWLDVRTPDEYRHNTFADSVNIPLAELREEMGELVYNAQYIICCDTGGRSESAGFLLSHRGFNVYVLEGGIAEAEEYLAGSVGPEAGVDPAEASSGMSPALEDAGLAFTELQNDYDELQQQFATLRAERQVQEQERQELVALLEQLRGELDESVAAMQQLHARVSELEEEKRRLGTQNGAVQAEQFDQLQSTRIELEQERHKCVSLQREIEALSGERALLTQQMEAGRQDARGTADSLQARLAEAQNEVAGLRTSLAETSAEYDRLQQENRHISSELAELHVTNESAGAALSNRDERVTELHAGNAALEQELQASRAELAALQAQSETMRVESAEQVAAERHAREAMELRLQDLQARLASDSTDAEESVATIAGLQEENSRLQGAMGEAGGRNEQLADMVERLQADIKAVETVHAADQEEWAQLRDALQSQLDEQRSQTGKLQEELEQKHQCLLQAGRDFEQQRLEEVEKNVAALERRDHQIADLGQKLVADTEQLELVQRDRQQLAEQLAEQQTASRVDGERLAALQDELAAMAESMQQQTGDLRNQVSAGEEQVTALRLEVERHEANRAAQDRELEEAQARIRELQQDHATNAEQVKALEQNLQDTERKAHEDIRRKNENEKELQAQAERLRKKLEQVTTDFQKSRKEAQADLDSLREELHAEREARDDERAQMAARQRELKEQLASIASDHEVQVNRDSGAIEEAVDAVRREERSRLQGVLEAQAATEQMLEKVQVELRQAHAELAEFHRQEKDRRQVDIDLIEEQNRQAEAAISQLQAQLRQLTEERDEAFDQQQALREKADSLRAEMEEARDLISKSAQGRSEDPAALRRQLEEARRNAEIAVRLRAEAETARDRMREDRDRLLAATAGTDIVLQSPPQPVSVSQPLQTDRVVPAHPPVTPAVMQLVGRVLRGLAAAAGVVVLVLAVGLAWLLFWQTPRGPHGIPARVERPAEVVAGSAAPAGSPAAAVPAPATGPTSQPQPGAEGTDAAKPGSKPETAPRPVTAKPQTAVHASPVLRTYSDPLRVGGRGPEMVELAGATYQMGSVGNSMNAEEVPRHEVKLASFSISRFEVTFADYDRYARATGARLPPDKSWGRGRQPVINVSWNDASDYVKWLSAQTGRTYRLPSEAQWEYAARAGSSGSFWWSDSQGDIPANCFNCGSSWDGARTAPVGQFAANSFGLYDMAGNVQEWTADCYHPNYVGAPDDGSVWEGAMDCMQRVVRGGAYSSPLDSLRSARRAQLSQDTRLDNLGFRVVRVH